MGEPPSKGLFPARNRIIAGLSLGVLVTEGAEDSGSLITAEEALKINRPVFAVPGPINSSLSKGPYKLIKKGAKLVTSAENIIQELGMKNHLKSSGKVSVKGVFLSKEEERIVRFLQNEPQNFDSILKKLKTTSGSLLGLISVLEIKGIIKKESEFFSLN